MVQQRSFKDYVNTNHFNEIFDAVENYVPNNIDKLNLWTKSNSIDIDNLDEERVFFDEMKVEFVFVNGDTLSNDVEFDVVVSGEVYFTEGGRHDDDYGSCTNWFRLNSTATIDGQLSNFIVNSVEPYDNKQNRFKRQLSDALVPIISSDDYEAQQFLNLYFPDALIVPQMVDPRLIAEQMGLTVVYKQITEDLSVFGQIFFHDIVVDGKLIKARTILVDDRIVLVRGLGALNNTILHECFHWHNHKLAFELVRLYNPDLSKIDNYDRGVF